jgi:hypothetical protein
MRVVLVVIVAMLILAGIATATYLGVRAWVGAGPGGIEVRPNFRLALAFETPPTSNVNWSNFSLGPGGDSLFATRVTPSEFGQPVSAQLMRVDGVDRGSRHRPISIFDFSSITLPHWHFGPQSLAVARSLGVASYGDVFFVAAGRDVPWVSMASGGIGPLALFVLHPDGSYQLLLTGGQLARSGQPSDGELSWTIAATAPNRVWLEVRALRSLGAATATVAFAVTASAPGCAQFGALKRAFPKATAVGFTSREGISRGSIRAPIWPGTCGKWSPVTAAGRRESTSA